MHAPPLYLVPCALFLVPYILCLVACALHPVSCGLIINAVTSIYKRKQWLLNLSQTADQQRQNGVW